MNFYYSGTGSEFVFYAIKIVTYFMISIGKALALV